MIIDSHAHYSHNSFHGSFRFLTVTADGYEVMEGSRDTVLEALRQQGIACAIEPGISLESHERIFALCDACPGRVFPAVGVHPTRTFREKWRDRKKLVSYIDMPSVIAVGETGLDYHYPRKEQHRLCQKAWFWYQLNIANKAKLPVILHIRDAHSDAIRILKCHRAKKYGGVVHCFAGGWDVASRYLSLGYHIGIGGTLLQANQRGERLCDAVKKIPLERILIETDSPYILPSCKEYIAPKVLRRTRNTSLILPKVIEKIAQLKGLTCDAVAAATTRNAIDLFSLPGFAEKET